MRAPYRPLRGAVDRDRDFEVVARRLELALELVDLPEADRAQGWILAPMERRIIPTGLRVAIPEGYEMQIRPRSGLALKHGLSLPNTPGTIDSD